MKILCVLVLIAVGFGSINAVPAKEVGARPDLTNGAIADTPRPAEQAASGIVSTTIPEPATMTLLMAGAAMILHRKKSAA